LTNLSSDDLVGVTEDLGKGFEKRFGITNGLDSERPGSGREEGWSAVSFRVGSSDRQNVRYDLLQARHARLDDLWLLGLESLQYILLHTSRPFRLH
jgi:hypothetical protein